MTKINVLSLDFDGCIFNDNYLENKNPRRVIEANATLIKYVSEKINTEKFSRVLLMVGDNRQSYAIDHELLTGGDTLSFKWKTGSAFIALKELVTEFSQEQSNTKLDGYLLADSYGNKREGENFATAVKKIRNGANESERKELLVSAEFSTAYVDPSKLTILYAQMHRVASQNPQAVISYDFYDDREDILKPLQTFFSTNRDLIPSNLSLGLHHYAGEAITDICSIQGIGKIDENYSMNIKNLLVCAGLCNGLIHAESYDATKHNIAQTNPNLTMVDCLTEQQLEQFKRSRSLFTVDKSSLLHPLLVAIAALKQYGEKQPCKTKGTAAVALADELNSQLSEYAKNNFVLSAEQQHSFLNLLGDQEKMMGSRRFNGKTILKNCALGITGVGLFALAGKAVHSWRTTGRVTLFGAQQQIQGEKQLQAIRAAFEKIISESSTTINRLS